MLCLEKSGNPGVYKLETKNPNFCCVSMIFKFLLDEGSSRNHLLASYIHMYPYRINLSSELIPPMYTQCLPTYVDLHYLFLLVLDAKYIGRLQMRDCHELKIL
jgi:hypothetical protein